LSRFGAYSHMTGNPHSSPGAGFAKIDFDYGLDIYEIVRLQIDI